MSKDNFSQDERVLRAKLFKEQGASSIGDLINSGKISTSYTDNPRVASELRKFTQNEIFTGNWEAKDENAEKVKKDLVASTIDHIIAVDKIAIERTGKSQIDDKMIPPNSKAVAEYIENEIDRCDSDKKDHNHNNETRSYTKPTTLSHLLEHHPQCISSENKKKILAIEVGYQQQEFGTIIKKIRSENSKEKKGEKFSDHEKDAMKILYKKNLDAKTANKDDIKQALVEARSKTMRGIFTNIKKIGFGASIKAAIMANNKSKDTGRSM